MPGAHKGSFSDRTPEIMVVDDDAISAQHLSLLFSDRGLHVRTFTNPLQALDALRGGARSDLIVTDYRMPEMDGLSFVEALRNIRPDVPIILTTAHGSVDTYLRFMSLGVFEYLNKPVSTGELERIAGMALGHPLLQGRDK